MHPNPSANDRFGDGLIPLDSEVARVQQIQKYPESRRSNVRLVSFDLRDVRQLPCLLEERLVRAVEPEEWKPTFAGHRGNPVRLLTFRRLRAGVEIHRAVGVALHLPVVGIESGTR